MSRLMNDSHLGHAIDVWCPTFPRRVTKHQSWAQSADDVYEAISGLKQSPGFISVYSFPDGHPQDGNVPQIDTMFIDMDIPHGGRYGRPDAPGEADREAWTADMEELLSVSRGVARFLLNSGVAKYWRASLSGHKGVHLYLDFPAVSRSLGTPYKYRSGLGEFSRSLVTTLSNDTGLPVEQWVDVDSSDLARLTRLPNTIHEGATRNFGEPRYCVPVTIGELAYVDAQAYERLTQAPRAVPDATRRIESGPTGARLTQYIAIAKDANQTNARPSLNPGQASSVLNSFEASEGMTLKKFLMYLNGKKPCMVQFRENPDCWKYGNQSHFMEFAIMIEARLLRVPVSVVCEFFAGTPDYDEVWTKHQYAKIISGGYNAPNHETLWLKAPEFTRPDLCNLCSTDMPRTTAF